jgi:hypothetical protein
LLQNASLQKSPSLVFRFNQDEGDSDEAEFFRVIGGKGTIASAESAGRDSVVAKAACKLLKVSDASGTLVTELVQDGNVKKSHFNSHDAFIFDAAGLEIFVWVGSGASDAEKKNALNIAMQYLGQAKLPITTPIRRILEGGETSAFNALLA